ncbi:hypothetical protein [Paenibacillus sp. BIHB 4019]|nr:hypothetical protein [Paenibacillus sp. BIHB 4019]
MINVKIRKSDANCSHIARLHLDYNGALPLYMDSADLIPRHLYVKAVRVG